MKLNVNRLEEPHDIRQAPDVNPEVQAFDFEALQRISAKLGVISLSEVQSKQD